MDKLLNEFSIRRPIDEAWLVLTDLERIAPCMPGAELHEVEGDDYRGVVKIKLGAIHAAFKGQASFVERDDEAHRAVLKAAGRDTGGKGNADALITARLEPTGDETTCIVETDLRISGKVAQFGRGIMADVSKKLMAQFAQNLNEMLETSGTSAKSDDDTGAPAETAKAPDQPQAQPTSDNGAKETKKRPAAKAAATSAADTAAAATSVADTAATAQPAVEEDSPAAAEADATPASEPTAAAPAAAASTDTGSPTVRRINGPAADPIELSGVASGAILKRVLPLVGGLAVVMLILRRLRK